MLDDIVSRHGDDVVALAELDLENHQIFVAERGFGVTDRLLPRRFRFEAGDQLLVVDKAVEEVVPFVG